MLKTIFSFVYSLCLTMTVSAVNFYVSTSGNNSNAGTQAQPWRTIQHACNNATPGSTVYIMAGTYTEQIWTNVSGTAGNYITFTHFNNDIVLIDGGSTGSQTVLWTIDDQSYLRIVGLKFANAMGNFSMGINVRNGADHIEIVDNEVYNIHFSTDPNATVTFGTNTNPIVFYGNHPTIPISNVVANGNHIHDCRTGASEALTATGDVDGFTFSDNHIHNITNIGIDAAGGHSIYPANPTNNAARNGLITNNLVYNCVSNLAVAAGIYADGSSNILIEHNTVHDCGRGYEIGSEINGQVATDVILRNNIAYHNREAAIGIGGYNYPSTGKVTNCSVLNNTCYDNVWTNNGDGELLIEYSENCVIANNLFHATNANKRLIVSRLNSTSLSLDYNLYFHTAGTSQVKVSWNGTSYTGFETYRNATGKDIHSVFGNPLMANPSAQNFHLTFGSPAYNAGDPAFIPAGGEVDIEGNARVLLGRVDIGVYESQTVLPVTYLSALSAQSTAKTVLLRWHTSAEKNHQSFEIERSQDGILFEKIAHIASNSDAQTGKAYIFEDKNPYESNNYYRLRQIDYNGQSTLSNIISVAFQALFSEAYPNPVQDVFEIKSKPNWEQIYVYDALGHLVKVFQTDDQTILTGLPSGSYLLKVFFEETGISDHIRIIKK